MKCREGVASGSAAVAGRVRHPYTRAHCRTARGPSVPSPSTTVAAAGPGMGTPIDAAAVRAGLAGCGRIVSRHASALTRLDAVLGDGDHGDNLVIGFRAVDELLAELPMSTPPGDLLRAVGHRLVAAVGGASGPLYGTACIEAGFVAGRVRGPRRADDRRDAPGSGRWARTPGPLPHGRQDHPRHARAGSRRVRGRHRGRRRCGDGVECGRSRRKRRDALDPRSRRPPRTCHAPW